MVNIPEDFINRGPVPGALVVSFVAEENAAEGSLVSCGTTYRLVKRCDIGETPIGYAQGGMVSGERVYVHLFNPMWKSDVDAGSASIGYGDILSVADNGKVKKASGSVAEIVVGISFSDTTAASGQVIYEPIVSVPDPITT